MSTNSQRMSSYQRNAEIAAGAGREQMELRRVECYLTEPLLKRILRRIFPDQRKQERLPSPPLVAYLGTQFGSKPYEIGDISLTGFCVLTNEHWMPGTEMPITLKASNLPAANERDTFTVQATVVRCDSNGVAFSIVLCEEDSQAVYGNPIRVQWVGRAEMEQYLKRLKDQDSAVPKNGIVTLTDGVTGRQAARAPLKTAWTESGGD
jgi:hypothetical protein